MKKIIIYLIFLFISCRSVEDLISIEQIESNIFPVMIGIDKETQKVNVINFPLVFSISLNDNKKVKITGPTYYCNSENQNIDFKFWDSAAVLFVNKNDSLILYNRKSDFMVLTTIPREYVVYTRHLDIDTSARVQNLFANYVSRMKTV